MKAFFKNQLNAIIVDSEPQRHRAGPSCFRMIQNLGLQPEEIQGELQHIFFASFDTTNALLGNVFGILARRKDVQQKLREEISSLKGKPPTKKDLGAVSFLRFILLEGTW